MIELVLLLVAGFGTENPQLIGEQTTTSKFQTIDQCLQYVSYVATIGNVPYTINGDIAYLQGDNPGEVIVAVCKEEQK